MFVYYPLPFWLHTPMILRLNIVSLHRCRFSQMLHPIFEEASNIVREEFPGTHQVVFARVDCDQHCECCPSSF